MYCQITINILRPLFIAQFEKNKQQRQKTSNRICKNHGQTFNMDSINQPQNNADKKYQIHG